MEVAVIYPSPRDLWFFGRQHLDQTISTGFCVTQLVSHEARRCFSDAFLCQYLPIYHKARRRQRKMPLKEKVQLREMSGSKSKKKQPKILEDFTFSKRIVLLKKRDKEIELECEKLCKKLKVDNEKLLQVAKKRNVDPELIREFEENIKEREKDDYNTSTTPLDLDPPEEEVGVGQ